MGDIVVVQYAGAPPTDETLRAELKLDAGGEGYVYVVPTLDQQWQRRGLAPRQQMDAEGHPQLFFPLAMRHLLGAQLLTRTEERVLIGRAMQAVARDEDRHQQLRHDVFAWRDALAELAARGLDLRADIPADVAAVLVNKEMGAILQALQGELHALAELPAFEQAARAYLDALYTPPPIVVLDGFTYLTPLQAHFVQVSAKHDTTVYLVHPYNAGQAWGFAALTRTYAPWATASQRTVPSPPPAAPPDLTRLQTALFADDPPATRPAADGSVALARYHHRQHEVATCIDQVQGYLQDGVEPGHVAIVMRKRGEFLPLLQEAAEGRGLCDAAGYPVTLGQVPRQLLLTPLGRFVLALYAIRSTGPLALTADQFETILASGWLGGHQQTTLDQFSAVKAQVFARCRTEADWQAALTRLRALQAEAPAQTRLAVAGVKPDSIDLWATGVHQIVQLSDRLFSGGARSIGDHVVALLDELGQLNPEEMREREQEVLERIKAVLRDLARARSLTMAPGEFGEVLNSLIHEYEQAEAEDETAPAGPRDHVWVTTPEGVDGVQVDVVFYLGLDDQRVPQPYGDPWPLYEPAVEPQQEKERYLFLAVVRAPTRALHLSYATADADHTYHPALYYQEVARLQEVDPARLLFGGPLADDLQPEMPDGEEPAPLRARREEYRLAEIAHYALCPFRYKLERLDPRARHHRDEWQLPFLAGALWLRHIFAHLAGADQPARGVDALQEQLFVALRATEDAVQAIFPGLRGLRWHPVRHYTEQTLRWLAGDWGKGNYPVTFHPARHTAYYINEGDRTVTVDATLHYEVLKGAFSYPCLDDALREEWLTPQPPDNGERYTTVDGIRVFRSLPHAIAWWREAAATAFHYTASRGQNTPFAQEKAGEWAAMSKDIAAWITQLETHDYPKHPGPQCQYCPVRGECLGLPEEDRR